MVYLKSYFNNYDLINDVYTFATEMQLSFNENIKVETLSIENDIWCEDSVENAHYVGRNYDGSSYYVGFIGDIIFANHDAIVDGVSFTSAGSGCPTCVECPEAITYIACLMEGDSAACQPDPFCPVDCVKGQYADEDYNCQNCVNDCDSCNNGVTCNTCQDFLCEVCDTCYNICDDENCKTNALWNASTKSCECRATFSFDETSHNCCYPHCLRCSDAELCDECEPFWYGGNTPNICNLYCVNGNYNADWHRCECLDGWSGDACDIPCDTVCLTCRQDDENYCTSCRDWPS